MACPKGFHRGVEYEHVEVGAQLACSRGTVTKYMDVCARGFKWKKSSRRSNLQMTTSEIKAWVDGSNSTTWWQEYWRRLRVNGSSATPSPSTSSSSSSSASSSSSSSKATYVSEDDRDRCSTEPITVKGMLAHTLSALQCLKDQQYMIGLVYDKEEDNLPLRDKRAPFPQIKAIFDRVEDRVKEYNTRQVGNRHA